MLWDQQSPRHVERDAHGRTTEVLVVAGRLGEGEPPPPPPRSWAARADTDVAIWCIKVSAGATWTLPATTKPGTVRTLYFFRGGAVRVDGVRFDTKSALVVRAGEDLEIEALEGDCELVLLQGRPIGEPVEQHGPFVMNTRAELASAFSDYQRTRFGGWPWPSDDPVHAKDEGRFARYPDGKVERVTR
jgi:redox-sensitive bicupin YhaK (pirin superfamily)